MISNIISQPGELRRARMALTCLPIWKYKSLPRDGEYPLPLLGTFASFRPGSKIRLGAGKSNANNTNYHCLVPLLRATPQWPNIFTSSLMRKTRTKTRMPPSPLPSTLTTRVGRRRGRGRHRLLRHRDLWRSPCHIGPALLFLLVQITRGTAQTAKHAPPWLPILYNTGVFVKSISTYMCYLNVLSHYEYVQNTDTCHHQYVQNSKLADCGL